jgi:hypothetical protein
MSFIEDMKPLLVPGVFLTQLILGNTISSTQPYLALLLNGIIFSIPFLVISLTRKNTQ